MSTIEVEEDRVSGNNADDGRGGERVDSLYRLRQSAKFFDHHCRLTSSPFFAGRDAKFLRELGEVLQVEIYGPGQTILVEGEVGETMYFLNRGKVEVLVGPNQVRVAEINEGTVFGEMALFGGGKRKATIRAAELCDCRVIHRSAFHRILSGYPQERKYFEDFAATRMAERKQNIEVKSPRRVLKHDRHRRKMVEQSKELSRKAGELVKSASFQPRSSGSFLSRSSVLSSDKVDKPAGAKTALFMLKRQPTEIEEEEDPSLRQESSEVATPIGSRTMPVRVTTQRDDTDDDDGTLPFLVEREEAVDSVTWSPVKMGRSNTGGGSAGVTSFLLSREEGSPRRTTETSQSEPDTESSVSPSRLSFGISMRTVATQQSLLEQNLHSPTPSLPELPLPSPRPRPNKARILDMRPGTAPQLCPLEQQGLGLALAQQGQLPALSVAQAPGKDQVGTGSTLFENWRVLENSEPAAASFRLSHSLEPRKEPLETLRHTSPLSCKRIDLFEIQTPKGDLQKKGWVSPSGGCHQLLYSNGKFVLETGPQVQKDTVSPRSSAGMWWKTPRTSAGDSPKRPYFGKLDALSAR